MRRTQQYNFFLPDYEDYGDVWHINENTLALENELYRQKLEDERLERDKATKVALAAHMSAAVLDHPDSSVTDDKLGNRTVLTTTGKLQALLTAIGSAVKAISGAATWNATPATTLAAAKTHMDDRNNVHAVTKAQVGLGNVDNTSDVNKPVSTAQAAAIKVVQDDVTAFKARRDNPHAVTKSQVGLGNADNTSDANKPVSTAQAAAIQAVQTNLNTHDANTVKHITAAERGAWNDKYSKAEVDNKFSLLETNIDWKESVSTYNDIATAYPNPQDGWTVNVKDTDYTYRYNGTAWVAISANAIPKATTSVDGLMTKEHVATVNSNTSARHTHANKALLDTYTQTEVNLKSAVDQRHAHANKALLDTYAQTEINLKSAVDQRHSHANKSVLDGITEALITAWNSAVTHISDAVKHITATERTLWNTVSTKLPLAGGTLTGFLSLHANPTANLHAATKQYVDVQIAGTGTGDMLKSVYDTTGNGIVDNAEKVNGLTVQTAVPAGAKFTDTVYSHPNSGAAAGTYRSVTVNAQGHVTAGTNPTTLAGYGIKDAEPAFTKNNAFNKNFGTAAGTVCQGNDARLSNARAANGGTSAACSGNAATATKLQTARTINGVSFDGSANITIADVTKEPAFTKNNAFNKNFGTAAGTVCQGNDARLSDARPANGGTAGWAKGADAANTAGWANGAENANFAFRADTAAKAGAAAGNLFLLSDVNISAGIRATNSENLILSYGTGTGYFLYHGNYAGTHTLCCNGDKHLSLGTPGARWNVVYAGSGAISTSDRNEKNSIAPLDNTQMLEFLQGLKPSQYKFNDGTSGRTHFGMIAQDVEAWMTARGMDSTDFAGLIKSPKSRKIETKNAETGEIKTTFEDIPGEYTYGLRYEEFIAPLIASVQELTARNDRLSAENAALAARMTALEQRLAPQKEA